MKNIKFNFFIKLLILISLLIIIVYLELKVSDIPSNDFPYHSEIKDTI